MIQKFKVGGLIMAHKDGWIEQEVESKHQCLRFRVKGTQYYICSIDEHWVYIKSNGIMYRLHINEIKDYQYVESR